MKFKAKLEEPRAFLGILQICRSIQRDCIVRLQSSRTRFFTTVDLLDGVQVWMGCRTDFLFSDFRCDSHYAEQSITCEILSMQQLMHILKQADMRQHSNRTNPPIMRLARNGSKPVLKLTMQGASQYLPDLSYDVPIRILSDAEIERMQAPPLEDDHVQVVVPNLFELATFVDKIKSSACDSITFSAQAFSSELSRDDEHGGDRAGYKRGRSSGTVGPQLATFHVLADNYLASFSLMYDAVEMIPRPRDREGEGEEDGVEEEEGGSARRRPHSTNGVDDECSAATVSVEVKKFARFFSAVREITPTRMSLYLVDQRALVLSVQASGNTTMVAYIPATRN